MTAGGGGGGGGGGTGDVLFPFKPVGEIVTVSVLGWLSMKGKSVKWISNKTGMKKESLYYHTYVLKQFPYLDFCSTFLHFFFFPPEHSKGYE